MQRGPAVPWTASLHDPSLTSLDLVLPAAAQVHLPSLVSPEGQKEPARAEQEEELLLENGPLAHGNFLNLVMFQ